MPSFQKRVLSLYLRNQCARQFVLYLYNDKERSNYGMPSRPENRSGLGIVGQLGYQWQDEKVDELKEVFGEAHVQEKRTPSGKRPDKFPLSEALSLIEAYQFIVEGDYEADTATFRQAVGLRNLIDYFGNEVSIGNTRPDVIQVLPPMTDRAGPVVDSEPNPYELAVLPTGEIIPLEADDGRLRLRVIDIKLTSEPGAHYFAEVVYYSMTLAAWLVETGYDKQFVVIAAPAVWPGSHEASHLAQQLAGWRRRDYEPTGADLIKALEEDLELAVFDVFAPRLRSFLKDELPEILRQPWDELPWHVDYHCKGCEFLGYQWGTQKEQEKNAELRCWPTAEREGNLSRIYGLSRGASAQLRLKNVMNIDALANKLSLSTVFNEHQGLKAKRKVFPHRAESLLTGYTSIVPDSGGDALMPSWPDLHIYLFLDYDLSSAITTSMAIRAFWKEPLPFGSQLETQKRRWPANQDEDEVFLVDRRDLEQERREFLRFLHRLKTIINDVQTQDDEDNKANRRDKRTKHSTYQIYLWDEAQRKHLVRLISRHLPHILADSKLRELAWLFPPPELLQRAEEATRQSAVTLVKPVVENTVAIDVPHYYRLLDLAAKVTPLRWSPPFTPLFYEEPLSDLIPMERLHEYWNKSGAVNWLRRQENIIKATRAKVYALSIVVHWLEIQLKDMLARQTAPPIIRTPKDVTGIAPVSRLWLGFTRLNAALDGLEKHTTRAMPPYEREARLKSARLERRLEGLEKEKALQQLNKVARIDLIDNQILFVYKMRADSREVNIQRGEFLYALAPENKHGFLDQNAYNLAAGTGFEQNWFYNQTVEEARLTAVTVEAIDRVNELIALKVDNANLLNRLEQMGKFDFSRHVVLDPIHHDFLTKKIELTLKGIKQPPSAWADTRVLDALGLQQANVGKAAETTASEILWSVIQIYQQQNGRDIAAIRQALENFFVKQGALLDDSQWAAWGEALMHRFAIIWGPPGTGKSHTLRAVILGAVIDARQRQQPLRLLITAHTYTAIDNVLLKLEEDLRVLLGKDKYSICRIQSKWRETPLVAWGEKYPTLNNLVLNRASPSQEIQQLRLQLEHPTRIIIVGCPPEQLHNLAIAPNSTSKAKAQDTLKTWFDFVLVDEASQLDVPSSTLVFSKCAVGATCVLAGDNLQLPPIHQADPPEKLENIVGSLYNYFQHHHKIEPKSLDINYRSNKTIVEFTKLAGYSQALDSFSPNLQLEFLKPIETVRPGNWPDSLYWTPAWGELLDPAYPAVSFVYHDVLSSQVNEFEADAVASLIRLLRDRLVNQLQNEKRSSDSTRAKALYEAHQFWSKAIGVVTPHRAQRAKVVNQLRQIFPDDSVEQIYDAVDTVERYQGQERDVIIASFGIGDPDLIEAEDEFLYSLNRFNVLASRARAKIVVFLTQSLLQHLSDDVRVLKESRLLKQYAESFCRDPQRIQLGYMQSGQVVVRNGVLRRYVAK